MGNFSSFGMVSWRSASLGSEPLHVSVKNTTLPNTPFSLSLLLNRSNSWWKGKEHRRVIDQEWQMSMTLGKPTKLLPTRSYDVRSKCKTNCSRRKANGRKELPFSNGLFCRDPMNSELIAIRGQKRIR